MIFSNYGIITRTAKNSEQPTIYLYDLRRLSIYGDIPSRIIGHTKKYDIVIFQVDFSSKSIRYP